MFEPPDTIEDIASAIDRRFLAPLRRPRTRRVGVELELPVWNRTPGEATDFVAVHAASVEFLAHFDFPDTALDDTEPLIAPLRRRADTLTNPALEQLDRLTRGESIESIAEDNLLSLVERGIDHIEVRCVDLNPLTGGLVDVRDVEFIHLFFLWCAALERETLTAQRQRECVAAFKAAARLDFDWTPVGELLERMDEFFVASAGWPLSVQRILAFEAEKVYHPEKRYARMETCHV